MPAEVECSVVVAVRNEEQHLVEALRSILDQVGVSLELIVVDDHSTDSTYRLAQSLADEDSRIRLFRNPREGKCSAFNFGIDHSTGDYVCLFAGDDLMPPASLRARLQAVHALGMDKPVVGLSKIRTMAENKRFDGVIVPRARGAGNPSGASTMMNRIAVETVFPVPECLPSEDTWMALAAAHLRQIRVTHSDVIACEWRVHAGNSSANMTEEFAEYSRKIADRMRALDLFLDHYQGQLDEGEVLSLRAKIHCEKMRSEGRLVGVLNSRVPMRDRVRALSSTNRHLYRLRQTFYSTLSGR